MKNKYILVSSLLAVLLVFGFTVEQLTGRSEGRGVFVVPPSYSTVQAGGTFLGPLANTQRTYQVLIHDTLLNDLDGMDIKALTYRLIASATSNWPAADVNFSNYDIYIGEGINPSQRRFTFDSNYALFGVKKKVRSGPLTILAGSFPSGGSPTTFGTDITFDSAYRYTGGHLTIEIRHQGFTGTSTSADAILSTNPNYGVIVSGCWASSYTATSTTTQGNFCIVRLNADAPVSVGNESVIVSNYSLNQNYPNPFNPVTNISFTIPKAGVVSLKIYDVSGTEVMTIINNEQMGAGTKSQLIDASALSSGVYFYSLFVDEAKVNTRKMMLIK